MKLDCFELPSLMCIVQYGFILKPIFFPFALHFPYGVDMLSINLKGKVVQTCKQFMRKL